MNELRMSPEELKPVAEALRKNGMSAYCVANRDEVLPLVKQLLTEGETVAVGGSVTLAQTGVLDLLRSGRYCFIDRYAEGLSAEERSETLRQGLTADTFLCSSNAVTRGGELYNVDGLANRVCALAYGPKRVVLVVGCNKIVDDLDAAARRVKTIAAPMNAKRLNCRTYCAQNGVCVAVDSNDCTDGCGSAERICSHYLISGKQRVTDRIHVILVGESLGF